MNRRPGSINWIVIALLLLVATSLSFLDRQVLSVSMIRIRHDLFVSDVEYGFINSGFLISYAIMFTIGGMLIDRFGSRRGLAYAVGFWSLATILHSVAGSVLQLAFFRFLLGIGEGGCFPGAVKAVIERVPVQRHALANGIAIGGSALGALVAPPLCAWLLDEVGWRVLFIITGGFGIIWLIFWLTVTSEKSGYRRHNLNPGSSEPVRYEFRKLIRQRPVITFIIIRFILDPIFYFYMFWIPKYLNESQSLSLETIGRVLWIPFLALGIGNFAGGSLSDLILKKTGSKDVARKTVMGIAAALTIPVVAICFIHSYISAVTLMALAFFAHGLWITNYITSISDVFGKNITSTVVGLSGTAGALSSLFLNPVIGLIVSVYSYSPLWWYAGLMYPVAFVLFILLIPRLKLVDSYS